MERNDECEYGDRSCQSDSHPEIVRTDPPERFSNHAAILAGDYKTIANAEHGGTLFTIQPREALIKSHMRDRGNSGRGQDGEDAV